MSVVALLATGQITLKISDQTDVSISGGSCGSNLTGSYQATITGTSVCSALQLWVTDSAECADTQNATNDQILPEVPLSSLMVNRSPSGNVSIPVNALPFFRKNQADGGAQCGAGGIAVTHRFCASVATSIDIQCASKQYLKAIMPVTINYDTLAPAVPTVTSAEPFEGAASIAVAANDSDTSSIAIQLKAPSDADFVTRATVTMPGATTISGLTNGTTYEVRAIAYDSAMNASAPSEVKTVTPRESQGFWDACRAAGCGTGGCNAMAAGPLGLAALGLLMLVRRVRR